MRHALETIQAAIRAEGLAGWLLYDFRGTNPIAMGLLAPGGAPMLTRRFLYWIPASGEPLRIQSAVEATLFGGLPGRRRTYRGWRDLAAIVGEEIPTDAEVALEYSPGGAIPTVAFVDAGTLEWLRELGIRPVSSADLVQRLEAPWDEAALASHRAASAILEAARRVATAALRAALAEGRTPTDVELQGLMLERMRAEGLTTSHPPIVAFGAAAGDPHHRPDPGRPRPLEPGGVVLLDYWGRLPSDGAVYADYTWMAQAGAALPAEIRRAWEAVRGARDAALDFLAGRFAAGDAPRGSEVDRIARNVIEKAGYGDHFVHRLGHSIGLEDHGPGANLDDLETRDERRLIEGVAFSIEPGVYLPDFGVRSEVNGIHWQGELVVTGELQAEPELLA